MDNLITDSGTPRLLVTRDESENYWRLLIIQVLQASLNVIQERTRTLIVERSKNGNIVRSLIVTNVILCLDKILL